MKRSKFTALILALTLCLSLAVPTFADASEIGTAGGTGTSTVTLSAVARTFSVTVPTTLAISVAADGTVTCATEARIVNNSHGQVEVTGVAIAGQNGWTVVDYASDLSGVAVNTKQLALKLNEKLAVSQAGQIAGTFGVINGGASSAAITYAANIPAQSEAVSATAASITFTIGWHTAG